MKEFSLRWIDVAASLAWVTCASFALAVTTGDADHLRPWVAVAASLGALATAVAWLSRRLDGLENHVYTEGMRAGYQAKQVVHLPEQRR